MTAGWTDERTKLLTERWEGGVSASLIAAELGTTRNAIIGKAHRLGLSKRADPATRKSTKPRAPKAPKVNGNNGGIWARLAAMQRGSVAGDLPPDSSPCAKSILDLIDDRSQCRYPVTTPDGEMQLFCAAPVFENFSYCARHCEVCYTRKAQAFPESSVKYFQSIGSVASRVVGQIEQRRQNEQAA